MSARSIFKHTNRPVEFADRVSALLRGLWRDERGQSTTEYILILAVVVMIAMKFKTTFQSKLGGIITDVGNNIDTAVKDQSQ